MRTDLLDLRKVALDALFPTIRQKVFVAALRDPEKWWYMSELADHIGTTPSSLQRELSSLVRAGILDRRADLSRVYFAPRQSCPVYEALRHLVSGDVGIRTPAGGRAAHKSKIKYWVKIAPRIHFQGRPIAKGDLVLKEYTTGKRSAGVIRERLWARVVKVEFTQVCGDLVEASAHSNAIGRRVCIRDREILGIKRPDVAVGI